MKNKKYEKQSNKKKSVCHKEEVDTKRVLIVLCSPLLIHQMVFLHFANISGGVAAEWLLRVISNVM